MEHANHLRNGFRCSKNRYHLWLSSAKICELLNITHHTLKSYQKDLYARLDVNSSIELVEKLKAQSRALNFDLKRHFPKGPNEKVPDTHFGG